MPSFSAGAVFSGGQSAKSYIEPFWSWLDCADADRGLETIPRDLTINGQTVAGVRYIGQDAVAGSPNAWAERGGAAGSSMANSDALVQTPFYTSAGDLVDSLVEFDTNKYWTNTAGTLFNFGTDDYIYLVAGWTAVSSLAAIMTQTGTNQTTLYTSSSTLFHQLINTWPSRVAFSAALGDDEALRHWIAIIACDRDHASGLRGYASGEYLSNGNPSAYQASIAASAFNFGASSPAGSNVFNGGIAALCAWHAADWLDAGDTTDLDYTLNRMVAKICGRHYTKSRGPAGYPICHGGRRVCTIEGVAREWISGGHTIETETNGGDLTWINTVSQGEYQTICTDGSEIPQNGEFTAEFWYKRGSSPGYHEPLLTISDGTAAEFFGIYCSTQGSFFCQTASASGNAGWVINYTDAIFGLGWQKCSVAIRTDRLSLAQNGIVRSVDTDVAVPTGLTTMRCNANYDASVIGQQPRFRCGKVFGFQVYAAFLHTG